MALSKDPLRYPVSVAVVAVALSAAALVVAPASAALPGEAANKASSVVAPVTAPTARSLPRAAPPSVPVAAPVTPQAPAQAPAQLPAKAKLPADAAPTGHAAPAAVTNTSEEAAQQVASPAGSDEALARRSDAGASASTSPAVGPAPSEVFAPGAASRKRATPSPSTSIGAGRAAPLRRWFARVWPAIALGGGDVPFLAVLAVLAKSEGVREVLDAARSLVLGISRASGDPAPARHPATPNTRFAAPDTALAPTDRGLILFVSFYFAVVLALLVSTIWTDLRARYR